MNVSITLLTGKWKKAILQDPIMSQILQDMQNDPQAIREHTKNPAVLQKLQVLANAGFIEMR